MQKVTLQIGLKNFLWSEMLKKLFGGHMLLVILIVNKLLERFTDKKKKQEEFSFRKVIKRKGDKLYVKWKGHDNSFNSWIDRNDIVI